MGNNNPFEVVIVITAFLLIVLSAFAIVAPSFITNINLPFQPLFPNLPSLDWSLSDSSAHYWNFSQSGVVRVVSGETSYKFEEFNPDKMVIVSEYGVFKIQRYGTESLIPFWYDEPLSYTNGSVLSSTLQPRVNNFLGYIYTDYYFTSDYVLLAQTIVNNYNGSYSTFIIDAGNNQYEAYISFYPLNGFTDMASSWNNGRGFNVLIYGDAYALPNTADQIAAYLSWVGGVISFFVLYVAYMLAMAGLFFTVMGLAPALSTGIIIIIITVFVGSILMYLRGNSGGK